MTTKRHIGTQNHNVKSTLGNEPDQGHISKVNFCDDDHDDYKDSINMSKLDLTTPCRMNSIEEYSLSNEMLLYSSDFEKGISLNKSSRAIWELCDGSHTLLAISQQLGQNLGISDSEELLNELLSDVIATIYQLRDIGVLTLEEADHAQSV